MRIGSKTSEILWAAIVSIIFVPVIFAIIYAPKLELYPKNETLFGYTAYSDGITGKSSSTSWLDTLGGHLHFTYKLDSNSKEPYATILFHAHKLNRTINLARYRYMNIAVDPSETDDFTATLYMYVRGFSRPDLVETHRPYSYICRINQNNDKYCLPLNKFATPVRWFSIFKITPERMPPTDWTKMTHLSLSDCGADTPADSTLHIFLKNLSFSDNLPLKLFYSILGGIVIFILLIAGFSIKSKIKTKNIKKRVYHPDSPRSYSAKDVEKLLKYLGENFKNPLLSLDNVEKETALNSFQVNEILSDRVKMNFKRYINYLRVEEAKKLIENTEHSLSDIASEVGYCYINSLSRAFKTQIGESPSEYRRSIRKKRL